MCRNITGLRGLEPPATQQEIEAAALQFVRKVAGLQSRTSRNEEAIDRAVRSIAVATATLLVELPPRAQPPKLDPPLRRLAARAEETAATTGVRSPT